MTTHPAFPGRTRVYKMPVHQSQPDRALHTHMKAQLFPIQHVDITQILLQKQQKSLCAAYRDAPTAFWVYVHPHASVHMHNSPQSWFCFWPFHPVPTSFVHSPSPPNWAQQSSAALPCSLGSLGLQRVNWDQRWGGGTESKLMMKMSPPCLCLN